MQIVSVETDGALRTEFLMRNTGEYPSVAVESTLSQILEDNVPEKYYLSQKACEGILRRAERRGKKLPDVLKTALEIGGADRYNQSFLSGLAQTLRASGGGDCTPTVLAPVAVYCHQGNGIDRAGKCLTEYSFDSLSSNSMKSKNPHSGCRAVEIAKTLDTGYPDPSKNQGGIAIVEKFILDDQGGQQISVRTDGKSPTLMAEAHGNGIDRADTAGCNGKGVCEDKCYTLNTIDRHAVCFPQQAYNKFIQEDIGATLKASGGTYGGGSENLVAEQSFSPIRYIVRRLTPTECARLQGFPDLWGHLDKKESFTDEEYKFWLEVRNTYARINNKAVKDYTKAQILTWYNKLHTDSAEYKMWGNGIALPNALYVMQGIAAEAERPTNLF